MEYRLKPRRFHAAQWDPNNPGPVTELLNRHHIHWNTYPNGMLVLDPKRDGIGVDPTDWVVIDQGFPMSLTDSLFHEQYEPALSSEES